MRRESQSEPARGEEGGARAPKILIVDDHAALRESIRDWLGSVFPGCCVLGAGTGEEGVTMACAEHPDAVLMDYHLPGMDGIEATRRIHGCAPKLPVVMLTVNDQAVYRAHAKAAGASGYVAKHQMGSELIPLLKTLLRPDEHDGRARHADRSAPVPILRRHDMLREHA